MKVGENDLSDAYIDYRINLNSARMNKDRWNKGTDTILQKNTVQNDDSYSNNPRSYRACQTEQNRPSNITEKNFYENRKLANHIRNQWVKKTDTILQQGEEFVNINFILSFRINLLYLKRTLRQGYIKSISK